MAITRREFLKYTAVMGGGLLLGSLFDLAPVKAYAEANPPVWEAAPKVSVCGYCSVGCSMLVGKTTNLPGYSGKEYVVYVQGNPDSPINEGALCSKGQASVQFSTVVDPTEGRIPNPGRLTYPLKREAGGSIWTTLTWTAAISAIATKVKDTRASYFVSVSPSTTLTVNRCEAIATLGGSSLSNESAYLISKLNRALGVVYLETQARN